MSWPQWPGGAVPQPVGVPQPGVVQTPVINPAPNVVNPAAPLMPTNQYTPEQWAQMQQQNWQQWAQWQQQFQQWQQQYGAEYQKSITALAQTRTAPVQPSVPFFNSAPPPLPAETKPPPPPDDPQGEPFQPPNSASFQPPNSASFSSFTSAPPPPVSQPNFSNAPPPPQPTPPKEQFQNKFGSNQSNQGGFSSQNQGGFSSQNQGGFSSQNQGGFPSHHRNDNFNTDNQRYGGNQNYSNNRGPVRNPNWQNQNNRNQPGFSDNRFNQPFGETENRNEFGIKRPYNQPNDGGDPKRNKTEVIPDNSRWKGNQQKQRWGEAPLQPENQQWDTKQTDNTAKSNPEELTEAEKKFDKQFADWEAQFRKWKEQNANHPDKEQYREYEKKWEAWRNQLLDRREQMRRKRLGLVSASPQPNTDKSLQSRPESMPQKDHPQAGEDKSAQGKTGPPPIGPQTFPPNITGKPNISGTSPRTTSLGTPSPNVGGKITPKQLSTATTNSNTSASGFSRPPPNLNDQPLEFKKSSADLDEKLLSQNEMICDVDDAASGFLKSSSGEGIPGLDLVKDTKDEDKTDEHSEDVKDPQNPKPDLEAISRGINSILGDQKLMNMLSLVSQNQSRPVASNTVNTVSAIRSPQFSPAEDYNQEDYDDYSNPENVGFYENKNQNMFSNDEQTRSSFNVGNEMDDADKFNENAGGSDYFDAKSNEFGGDNIGFHQGPDRFNQHRNDNFNTDNQRYGGNQNYSNNRGPVRNPNWQNQNNRNQPGFNDNRFNQSFGETENRNEFGIKRPFNQPNDGGDFNRGPGAFNRESEHFNRGANDYNRFNQSFGETENRNEFGIKRPFNQPNDEGDFNRGPGDFNRESEHFNRDANDFNRDRDTFNRGPDNFNRCSDNFTRNFDNFDSENINEGPDNFSNRGPNNFNNFNRGPDNFDDNFNRGSDNFNRNLDRFNDNFRGPNNINDRVSNTFNKDSENCNQTLDEGPKGFNMRRDGNEDFSGGRGPDNFVRAPRMTGNFNEDSNSFDREQENFNRVPQNFDNNREPDRAEADLFQPPEVEWNKSNPFPNDPMLPQASELPEDSKDKPMPDEGIWKPKNVIDYDHKTLKPTEPDVILEAVHTFDYRHKPLNRIPYPQRPKWLSDMVRNYPEFDLVIPRPFEPQQLRRYPVNERFDSYQKYDDRDRKIYDDRDRKQYDDRDRKPHDDRDRRSHDVRDRKSYEDRDRKPYEDRKSYDDSHRKTSDNKPFEDRKSRDDDKKCPDDQKFSGKRQYGRDTIIDEHKFDDECEDIDDGPFFKDKKQNRGENSQRGSDKKLNTKTGSSNVSSKSNVTLIEDLLSPPGRFNRPPRLVIILRGPPGSGKSFLAKLIKDKEVENGGSAPRILCLDDYFMVEQEKEAEEDGRKVKVKEMVYEYEECMEASYRQSLMKAFKKTITDGYFNFIIVDNINEKVKYFGEMWSFAKQNGFQVYISQMELDVQICTRRNIHGRSEVEIERCVAGWEQTPAHHPVLDATSLIQSGSIPEVEMEEINSPASENMNEEEHLITSKWDSIDYSVDNLAKLDGTNKPLRASRTMEDYLQLDDEWIEPVSTKPGQKRVRWADLEERKKQEKMRAIGFVVGQTNWDRMMDPTMGSGALTQTKYIERYNSY